MLNKITISIVLSLLVCTSLKTSAANDTTTYTIPVVVHVIHDFNVSLYGDYPADNDLYLAVSQWDSILNAMNPDTVDVIQPFKKYIGSAHIHLKLATKDPYGNPTKGITRHFTRLTYSAADQSKLDQWPPDKYLNVWVVRSMNNPFGNSATYAYKPSVAATLPYYDGVMILGSYIFDMMMPHGIAHYLDLKHTWGGENADPTFVCGDDGIDDTPPTKGHAPQGCTYTALYDTICASGYLVHYLDAQNQDSVVDYPDTVNAQNIMDMTFCAHMFTKGQCEHMRAALLSNVANRNSLITQTNLDATGAEAPMPDMPPVPAFSVEKGKVTGIPPAERTYFYCADDPALKFSFIEHSWNDTVTSVHWHFSNSADTPDFTYPPVLGQTIYNQFSQPGWVTISLTATGNNTGSATLTDTQAVYAADGNDPIIEDPANGPMHFMEFDPGQTDNWPIFNYYKNNFKWQLNNNTGYYDNTSMEYMGFDTRQFPDNTTGGPAGDFDDFFSPAYDLSAMSNGYCNLNFMSAGTCRNTLADMKDTLEVKYSIDCGRTWKPLLQIGGAELDNNGSLATAYAPLWSGEWKLNSVELPQDARSGKTFFRFRYRPGTDSAGYSTSNNFYIDRISISNFPTGVGPVSAENGKVTLAPNPADAITYLVITGNKGHPIAVNITDVSGRVVYHSQEALKSEHELVSLPTKHFANGIYFVVVQMAGTVSAQKLLVRH